MAPDRLDFLGDGERAAPLGAFERHVLEKMRDAVGRSGLVPRADIDPDAERDRIDRIDLIGGDPQSILQRGKPSGHAAALVRRAWAQTKRATAPRSLGTTISFSGRSKRSAKADGNGGRMPVARSTASGNFPGWAQPRAIIGAPPSRPPSSACAAATATAVWGSISTPDRA